MKEIKYLKKGDTISLVAPSFGCTTEPYLTRLDVAISNLKDDGFIKFFSTFSCSIAT